MAYRTKDGIGSKIRETIYNLDTVDGLMKEMAELEAQHGKSTIIVFYKRLNYSFWRDMYEKILSRLHDQTPSPSYDNSNRG